MPDSRPLSQLLIQTAFLGDVLLGVPLLKEMRARRPSHKLILVCRKGVGSIFLDLKLADEIVEVKKGDGVSYEAALKKLQEENIDVIYCPHESLRTAFFVSKLNARRKVGFTKWWNGAFFGERVKKIKLLPDPLRQLQLISKEDPALDENIKQYALSGRAFLKTPEGQLSAAPNWASMGLRDRMNEMRSTWTRLMEKLGWSQFVSKSVVCLFPGSVWATKRWTEQGFVETGRALQAKGHQVLIMGGPGEEAICARVAGAIPGSYDLCGKTGLLESALVLAHADLVVANDSASAHLASLAETPTIAIFGPTVVEFGFRPWGQNVFIAEKRGLACRPCGPHGHEKCPRRTHECMKNLGSNEVLDKADLILR